LTLQNAVRGEAASTHSRHRDEKEIKPMNKLILLVNPSTGGKRFDRKDRLRGYLSLGTLASALRDQEFLRAFNRRLGMSSEKRPAFDVRILQLSLKPPEEDLWSFFSNAARGLSSEPLIVGMTASSTRLEEARGVAEVTRALWPHALRVIGGPHVSAEPGWFLRQSDYELACLGDGVETLSELALRLAEERTLDLATVPGIAYKDNNGMVRQTPRLHFLFPLDGYPFPSRSLDLFLEDADDLSRNAEDVAFVLGGMGCPYDCAFCAQQAIHQGMVRERSAEAIFAEMASLHKRGFHRFALVQESLLRDRQRMLHLCELIDKSGVKWEWTLEARADQVDRALLERMRQTGLRFIQVGLESGDQHLLERIGKGIRLEQVAALIDWCRELRIHTTLYLLVGLPGQGWGSILNTADFVCEHLPYNGATMHASVAIAIPYPGTRLDKEKVVRLVTRGEGSIDWPDRNPDVVVDESGAVVGLGPTETDAMSSAEILKAFWYLDDFCHFTLHAFQDGNLSHKERLRSLELARWSYDRIAERASSSRFT
jgi:anaerobic magnesium-protoporphyrin IX monomethyl ester cyclase